MNNLLEQFKSFLDNQIAFDDEFNAFDHYDNVKEDSITVVAVVDGKEFPFWYNCYEVIEDKPYYDFEPANA